MNPLQRQRLIERHRDSLDMHGYSPDALFWSSRGLQKVLFRVLAEIGVSTGDSLLDVGCGFGDLHSWLRGSGKAVDYTGIDLSPDIIAAGARMNPGLRLLSGELFDFDWSPQTFDWVVLSGTLNWDLGDDGEYTRRVIRRMFQLCRQGVAFNMLNVRRFDAAVLGDMKAHDPVAVLDFCRAISPDCYCRNDYLPDDFTIYIRRT
ncbi:MAG: SAM-dependent methyltransferase [Zetaproteobacteria bacterium CG12_big_fil_rev_8_21_14_0_65_54_13]|nr:MAG: SAM-dependent methyltransferase [Zetaproteobacteria bacterium CG12_big_fil_rev_8_21_14_0_65_54_13]PIX53424.1 MAG: SAM-dependent methyltransferase [Zetaproteobacteria bacterium CG_4_10_14_3_um_filter_54_28]PJA31024.1 MAG: SAM-dependent methyltransferase [Zetaproteobacteria bacterium CG_4_9_14_3_um_filter_54_145]